MRKLACDCGNHDTDDLPEGSTLPLCSAGCGRRMHYEEHSPTNHPKHYTSHPSGIECIQIAEHFTFCIGQVFKYIWRAGLKGDVAEMREKEIQDLKKGRWYLDREIQRLEKS